MNKVAQYLQQHLGGEIVTSADALEYFSTDGSVLTQKPLLIVYPRSEQDIRKIARFTWQLGEKGKVVAVTPRGNGGDMTGAAIGDGIIVVFPAHLHKIIELDPKSGVVVVEAGATLEKIQQTLHTHGRFLPTAASTNSQSTIGGAVANNDSTRSSYKYGPMQQFVRSLRVVLANGELIDTGRLTKRELNKKLGLASFEGEVYRSLDKLIEESPELIAGLKRISDHNAAGYDIADVKQKDGSFDLTPLFVGSQGTLGTIVEVTLETEPHNPETSLLVAGFADRAQGWAAVKEINELKEGAASIDFIDMTLIKSLEVINPVILKPLHGGVPGVLLFIEIDEEQKRGQKKIEKRIKKVLNHHQAEIVEPDEKDQHVWLRLRDSASMLLSYADATRRAVPVLDDAQVPVDRMAEFSGELDMLMQTAGVGSYALWGQAGTGLIHVAPFLDISSVGDRQKMFKIMDAYYSYVCSVGGSLSGEYAEGRLRGLFTDKLFSEAERAVFTRIKNIFDPLGTMNRGVKIDVSFDEVKQMIRSDYKMTHEYNRLPRG